MKCCINGTHKRDDSQYVINSGSSHEKITRNTPDKMDRETKQIPM